MEKVKLTADQAFCIEDLRGANRAWMIGHQDKRRWNKDGAYKSLNSLSLDQFLKAFYAGYEIEPEKLNFNIGDAVIVNYDGEEVFSRIKGWIREKEGTFFLGKGHYGANSEIARHATPEEIYWLETLNRKEIAEFKNGDVFVDGDDEVYILGGLHELNDAKEWYEDHDCNGIYPAESFKPFPKEQPNE